MSADADRGGAMTDAERALLAASLEASRGQRKLMLMGGVLGVGVGAMLGTVLGWLGQWLGALLFPAVLVPTGGLLLWLGARSGSLVLRDLETGEVSVLEGEVEGKRELRLPQSTTYLLRVDGRDVFVGKTAFAGIDKGARVRIRRSRHAGVALGVEPLD